MVYFNGFRERKDMDVRFCIDTLRSEGFTDRRVERVFGLAEGFLARTYLKNAADKTSTSLLNVLANFPFMVQVAETGYDAVASKQIKALWISLKLSEVLRESYDKDTLVGV